MENNRPKLTDPQEWAIVREMYFDTSSYQKEPNDSLEELERLESRLKNNNISSR